jgi:hypothetical protein
MWVRRFTAVHSSNITYPQKALELLLKLSEFVLPKLRAIEVNNESEEAMHTSLNINIIDTGVPLASCELINKYFFIKL